MNERNALIPESHILILARSRVGFSTWAVYSLIMAHRNYKTGVFKGTQGELAHDIGISRGAVFKAEQSLVKLNLIRVEKSGRGRIIHTQPPARKVIRTETLDCSQNDSLSTDRIGNVVRSDEKCSQNERSYLLDQTSSEIYTDRTHTHVGQSDPYGPEFDKPF